MSNKYARGELCDSKCGKSVENFKFRKRLESGYNDKRQQGELVSLASIGFLSVSVEIGRSSAGNGTFNLVCLVPPRVQQYSGRGEDHFDRGRWMTRSILSPAAAISGTVRQQSKSWVLVPLTWKEREKGKKFNFLYCSFSLFFYLL